MKRRGGGRGGEGWGKTTRVGGASKAHPTTTPANFFSPPMSLATMRRSVYAVAACTSRPIRMLSVAVPRAGSFSGATSSTPLRPHTHQHHIGGGLAALGYGLPPVRGMAKGRGGRGGGKKGGGGGGGGKQAKRVAVSDEEFAVRRSSELVWWKRSEPHRVEPCNSTVLKWVGRAWLPTVYTPTQPTHPLHTHTHTHNTPRRLT
jgi:hypothetical protein